MRESPLTMPNALQKLKRVVVVKKPKVPRPLSIAEEDVISPTHEPIPGLFLFENFNTPQEEQQILEELDRPNNVPWKLEQHSG